MIDLDKWLSDISEFRSERGEKRRKRQEMKQELGKEAEGMSDEDMEYQIEKKKSEARKAAIRNMAGK